jgi:hypothetical protein
VSFVSIIAQESFITVVSDGQVTLDGEILESHYKKFKRISKDQFIAYTGSKEICEELIKHLVYLQDKKYNLQLIADELYSVVKEIPFKPLKALLAVGGINDIGNVQFYTFSNIPNAEFLTFQPKNDEISYAFLSSEHVDDEELENDLIQYLSKTGFNTPNKCLKAQKMLNAYVETIDETVNKNTFELAIKK